MAMCLLASVTYLWLSDKTLTASSPEFVNASPFELKPSQQALLPFELSSDEIKSPPTSKRAPEFLAPQNPHTAPAKTQGFANFSAFDEQGKLVVNRLTPIIQGPDFARFLIEIETRMTDESHARVAALNRAFSQHELLSGVTRETACGAELCAYRVDIRGLSQAQIEAVKSISTKPPVEAGVRFTHIANVNGEPEFRCIFSLKQDDVTIAIRETD